MYSKSLDESSDGDVGEKLLLEEYKSCRDLIGRNIEIIERTEVYAIGAAAVTFAFVLSASDPLVARLSCWLPLAISSLGLIRFMGIDATIDIINNRLAMIERRNVRYIRWTRFYRRQNKIKRKSLKRSRYAIWWVLVALSSAFALFITLHGPSAGSKPTLDLTIHQNSK